jgi:hypothetical protein
MPPNTPLAVIIKSRVERHNDRIEAFFDSIGHLQTSRRTLSMVRFTPESCRDRWPIATAERSQ